MAKLILLVFIIAVTLVMNDMLGFEKTLLILVVFGLVELISIEINTDK